MGQDEATRLRHMFDAAREALAFAAQHCPQSSFVQLGLMWWRIVSELATFSRDATSIHNR